MEEFIRMAGWALIIYVLAAAFVGMVSLAVFVWFAKKLMGRF